MVSIALVTSVVSSAAASYGTFTTSTEVSSNDLVPFSKWTGVLQRFNQQRQASQECADAACPSQQWKTLIEETRQKSDNEKLAEVNRFFNHVRYVEDINNWQKQDYWATPYEMMERGGDCEDYAIAKYMALKELGISERAMRVIIVRDMNLRLMHAVLEVRVNGARYILDNQVSDVVNEEDVNHYSPIYAINTQQWWAYK